MFYLLLFIAYTLLYLNNKEKEAYLLHIFSFTYSFQFFIQDTSFGFSVKPTDLSLLFLAVAYIHRAFKVKQRQVIDHYGEASKPYFIYFFFIPIGISIYSNVFRGSASYGDIFVTTRVWYNLLLLPLYRSLPPADLEWIFKKIVQITLVQLIIVPLQPILPFEIPFSKRSDGFGGFRYGLMPYFWNFTFWYLCFMPVKTKSLKIALLLFDLIFAQMRKNVLSLLTGGLFLFRKKITPGAIAILFVFTLLFIIWFQNYAPPRMKEFPKEFATVLALDPTAVQMYSGDQGNMVFRAALFLERFHYLRQRPIQLFTGFGLMHETRMKVRPFLIGLEGPRGIVQLDTGDISWMLIMMRYGFIGVIVLFGILLVMLRKITTNGTTKGYGGIGQGLVVSLLTLSFGDASLATPAFIILMYWILLMTDTSFEKRYI